MRNTRHAFTVVHLLGFCILAILLLLSPALNAQSANGAMVGRVADGTGAVVPQVKLTLTNLGTNDKLTATTDAEGNYRFANLLPATYRLETDVPGFKRTTRQPITVEVGASVRIEVALAVGTEAEVVEVTSQTPLLETDTGSLSDVVEGKQVEEMPLNGRNTMNLLALTPGVVAGAPSGASALNLGTHTANGTWSDYSISGGYTGANAMYIDGAGLNLLGGNVIAFIPTQDAVQEFQVISSGVSPEFGRFGGGVINMSTKSGTNQYHGSVYEYFRNRSLNANNFFSIQNGQSRPEWNQNQYGVRFANPILKDKLFSFFSWEGFRLLLGVPAAINVPTQAMRNGTFTQAIKDPLGRAGCVTQPTPGTYQITPSCFDPTATVMLNDWPLANAPHNPNTNFVSTPVTGNNANQYNERVDYNLSQKQRLFARYSYWGQVDIPFNQLGNFTKNAFSHNRSTQAVLGDTYTLSSRSLLDVRLAYDRQFTDNQPYTLGEDLSKFGPAWAALQGNLSPRYEPGPHILGPGNLYPFFGMDVDSETHLNAYDLTASFSTSRGKHNLKVGGEIRLSDNNGQSTTLDGGGSFIFLPLPFLSGNNFADFLFGIPASATFQKVSAVSTYNYYQGYYVADTWQARRNLTLNMGLRWELPGTFAERHNRDAVLLPNTADPTTGHIGTLASTASSLYPSRGVTDSKHNLFSPRFGFAYRINEQTTVRGAYTLSYLPPDLAGGTLASNSLVNTATTSFVNSPGPTPYFRLSQPPSTIINPVGNNITAAFRQSLVGQILAGPVPHQVYPYTQQWNLSVGHQFANNLLTQVNYAGASASNLPIGLLGLDELPRQYWTTAGAIQSNRPYNYVDATGAHGTYQDVQNTAANVGVSNYEAAIFKVEKRFSSGGVISANYTYAKNLADVESPQGSGNGASSTPNTGNGLSYLSQDYNNLRGGEYSLSSFDVRHNFVVSYVVDLPFGEGKRYAHYSGLAGKMVSGFAVNGISNFRKGFPLQFTQSGNTLTNSFGYGSLRPNRVAGCNAALSGATKNRLNQYFNPACFTPAADLGLGSENRTDQQVRLPGVDNFDFSLLKTTQIKDSINVQFRAEVFNLFNHPQFAAPGSEIDGGEFGVITAQINNPRLVQFSLRVNF